jgi:hypothetical protein
VRPDFQIFAHVLCATVLFGSTGAVAVLSLAARRRTDQLPLARASLRTLLVLTVPAWALTFVFGVWAESKENLPDGLGWLDLGFRINDFGLLLLLVTTVIAWRWTRRPDASWPATTVAVLTCLYLVALGVAWWVMTAKVPT